MTSTGSWGPNRVPSSMAQTLTGSPSSRPAASSMPARIPKSQSACGKLLSLTSAFTRLRIPREFRIWTVRAKYTSETWPALISGSLATWKARLGWLVIRAREPRRLPEVPAIVPETGGEVNRTKARSGPQTAVRQGISGGWMSGFDSRARMSLPPHWTPAGTQPDLSRPAGGHRCVFQAAEGGLPPAQLLRHLDRLDPDKFRL